MKTVLYDNHVELGGKIVDFAGWEMPLWYGKGQSVEHKATREAAGLFDICHMGEFMITGTGSKELMANLLTNNVLGMKDGQAMYNFMLNENGGVIDDCIVYRFNDEKWMLVVNAGNITADFDWILKNKPESVTAENLSDKMAKLDLQGPKAPAIIKKISGEAAVAKLGFFKFRENIDIKGCKVLLSRTGYTGEIGFEIYADANDAVTIWNAILEDGAEFGVEPVGLGARDSLRTEAGLPLHGHELKPDVPAVETPWNFAIDFDSDFIGKEALLKERENGVKNFVYPFLMDGRSKAMHGWNVLLDNQIIGHVESGVIAPSMKNKPIGYLVSHQELEVGTKLTFNQEGKKRILEGSICESPFVKGTSRKKMKNFI